VKTALSKKILWLGAFALSSALTGTAAAAQPTANQQSWSSDGWLYQWVYTDWKRTAYSRTFPARGNTAIYDTYINGQLYMRIDHSEAGWINEFNHQTKARIKYPVNNPNAKYLWVDNASTGGPRGWLTAAQATAEVARLQRLQAQQPQRAAATQAQAAAPPAARQQGRHPFIKPHDKLMQHNVREEIPVNDAMRTPEERLYVRNSNQQALNGMNNTNRRAACESARFSEHQIRDAYGNVKPDSGYHDTMLGARANAC
jgi:hypothetical protein